MLSMKKSVYSVVLWFIKAGTAAGIALVILSIILSFYNFSGIHITSNTGATDYTWESNQWKATMEEGFAWINMDENGFNNAYERVAGGVNEIDILLMGSSHMEAVNVPDDKNTGYYLNELIEDSYTYNIGISGHTIYNCFNNLEDAVNFYHPRKWVIVETDRIKLDIDSMQAVIDEEYGHIPSYDTGVLYVLQKYLPAVKALYNKMNYWKNMGVADAETEKKDIPDDKLIPEEYIEILDKFLKNANAKLTQQELVIFYHPQTIIDSDGSYIINKEDSYIRQFESICEDNRIKFIDMSEDFEELYNTEYVLAHGFINTAVGVGHLNAKGHEVVAQRLAIELQDQEN